MIRSRVGLKALVLGGLVLGLMTFTDGAAQAEVGATWTIVDAKGELRKIPDAFDLLPQLQIKQVENATATLLYPPLLLEILCTSAELNEGAKLLSNGTISLGRALFKGCITLLSKKVSLLCQAHSPGRGKGELLSEKFTGLIVLDESSGKINTLVRIAPDEGTSLLQWEFGEECVLGSLNLIGELWLKDGGNAFTVEQTEHLIAEGLQGLTIAGKPATIDGSAMVSLLGVHSGMKWAGTPN